MKTIVKIDNVEYSYAGNSPILRNLSFEIYENEVFVLLGHNGAGKTTLIRILLDFLRNYSGNINLFGFEPVVSEARQKIGFMSELPAVYDYETAHGYLNYFAGLSSIKNAKEKINQLLEQTGLIQHKGKKLAAYSKGMLQRLNLSRALLKDPDLLIMDEPVIGLDPLGQALIEDVVHQQRKKGKSVFINTHSVSFAARMADRVGFLMGGELKKIFKRDEYEGGHDVLQKAFLEYSKDLSLEDKAR
ncbi:MAG: ABC transporter ATP-binding protein [Candidatus Rifleibacteriota bacterium]